MDIQHNVSLKDFSTMHLGGTAAHLVTVSSKDGLESALAWAEENNCPVLVVGEGSNIIWRDGLYNGLVIVNRILGLEKTEEDVESVTYKIGGGEMWDSVVEQLVGENLSGIEFLSLIPGTAGATPVQNVGAYGQEIANTLVELEAYDVKEKRYVVLKAADCNFAYRDSRFKSKDKGRFYICSITLKLEKKNPEPPFYAALEAYLKEHEISEYTPRTIRQAVIAIRSFKLPDWRVTANTGSFFGNPIISAEKYEALKSTYESIVGWDHEGDYKISAGWLIEAAGFKGYHDEDTGMATFDHSALVLINERAGSTADLIKFRDKIILKVEEMFGITLEQEPELLP